MNEMSRITIENYCMIHKSAKSRRLAELVEMSYDMGCIPTDSDAIFLERCIEDEADSELQGALIDLDDFLFRW